jgi:hypothetical protein
MIFKLKIQWVRKDETDAEPETLTQIETWVNK